MRNLWVWLCVAMVALALGGCGHTDEEMATKQREIDKLSADLKAAKAQIADDQAKFSEASNSIDKMKEQLKAAGLGLEKSKEDAARLAQALAEYKQRADQLAVIEARFRELRSKLDKLNSIGVKVVPRNNRLVIQLPGDILFDSGKDDLKPHGKEVLGQVAEVIRSDKDLMNRYFHRRRSHGQREVPAGRRVQGQLAPLARARASGPPLPDRRGEGRGPEEPQGDARAAGSTRRAGPRLATARPTRSPARWRSSPTRTARRTAASSSSFSRTSRKC